MTDRDLLKKIRKCFALGASDNENEAAAAIAKARALMDEHGVTDAMLEMAEVEEAVAAGGGAQSPALWQRHLVGVVRLALNVEAFLDDKNWRFVGRGPSADIAAYAFAALFRRLKAARADYVRVQLRRCTLARKRIRADAFCEGWALSVFRKVAALAPQREVDPVVQTYLTINYPGLVPCSPRRAGTSAARTASDYWAGLSQGREVDLHHGMSGSTAQKAIAHD